MEGVEEETRGKGNKAGATIKKTRTEKLYDSYYHICM